MTWLEKFDCDDCREQDNVEGWLRIGGVGACRKLSGAFLTMTIDQKKSQTFTWLSQNIELN